MRVIIVGCGRVGSALALRLTAEGNDTWVIDRRAQARHALPDGFTGHFLEGNGYNRAVLDAAGITHADALVAVTGRDNGNIVTARVARRGLPCAGRPRPHRRPAQGGHLPRPGHPHHRGVRWAVHRLHRMLSHRHLAPESGFGNGETLLIRSGLPGYLTGRPLSAFEVDGEIRVVEVTRGGPLPRSLTPAPWPSAGTWSPSPSPPPPSAVCAAFLGKELGT